jgi:hypothetical protein
MVALQMDALRRKINRLECADSLERWQSFLAAFDCARQCRLKRAIDPAGEIEMLFGTVV